MYRPSHRIFRFTPATAMRSRLTRTIRVHLLYCQSFSVVPCSIFIRLICYRSKDHHIQTPQGLAHRAPVFLITVFKDNRLRKSLLMITSGAWLDPETTKNLRHTTPRTTTKTTESHDQRGRSRSVFCLLNARWSTPQTTRIETLKSLEGHVPHQEQVSIVSICVAGNTEQTSRQAQLAKIIPRQ